MANLSHSSKKTSPAEVRERASTTRDGLRLVSDFFSEKVLLAIHSAAADATTWQRAMREPQKFFASNHIEIPDGVFLRFLEAPKVGTGDTKPLVGLQIAEPRPIACPPGQVPTLIRTTIHRPTKLMEWHIVIPPLGGNPEQTIHGWFPVDSNFEVLEYCVCSSPTDWWAEIATGVVAHA